MHRMTGGGNQRLNGSKKLSEKLSKGISLKLFSSLDCLLQSVLKCGVLPASIVGRKHKLAGIFCQLLAQQWVAKQPQNSVGNRLRILWWDQQSALFMDNNFRHPASIGSDASHLHRHCLLQHHPERFGVGSKNEQIKGSIHRAWIVEEWRKNNTLAERK